MILTLTGYMQGFPVYLTDLAFKICLRETSAQVISEGWAPPLRGFMREGVLLQALHFNSLLIDPFDDVGAKELNFQQTNWNNNEVRGRKCVLRAPIYDLSRIMRLRCQHGEYSFAGA